jgi:hypothetical protein
MWYTVLVQRPDWIADPYGLDTYLALAHVEAQSVLEAQGIARGEAWDSDHAEDVAAGAVDESEKDEVNGAPAYAILAVFEGHLDDVSQEEES